MISPAAVHVCQAAADLIRVEHELMVSLASTTTFSATATACSLAGWVVSGPVNGLYTITES